MADTDKFWTAEEVSNYLRIPQSTIYKLAQDKVLPGFKVGKHWRFRRETILEWIKVKENLAHENNNCEFERRCRQPVE